MKYNMLQFSHAVKQRWAGWLVVLMVGWGASKAVAQPVNDRYTNATVVAGYAWTVTGNNNNAGTEQTTSPIFENRSVDGRSVRRTVWWTWTAPSNGLVRVDTLGSSFDTVLGVYSGGAQLANLIAGNNNTTSNSVSVTQSRVNFTATSGTKYDFQVGGNGLVSGNILLNLNYFPEVKVTSPTNGSSFFTPANYVVQAVPHVYTGAVAQVQLYQVGSGGTNLLATWTNAPFELALTNVPIDQYQYFATILDDRGDSSTSPRINVEVRDYGVRITSPSAGQLFNAVSNISVTASTAWTNPITRVDFLSDGQQFGQSSGVTAMVNWTNFTAGVHALTAIAFDGQGNSFTSPPVNVIIKPFAFAIQAGSVWKYLDNGTDQGSAWTGTKYDDSAWVSGPAQLGYGDGDEATVVSYGTNASSKYITTYFRHRFNLTNVASVTNLICRLKRDDGAVVYLNGVRLYADNLSAQTVTYTTLADAAAPDDGDNFNESNRSAASLVEGENVLAVEIHQNSATSSDLSFDFEMIAEYDAGQTTVAMTYPANNGYLLTPGVALLNAVASNTAGGIARVEFFSSGTNLGPAAKDGSLFYLTLTNLSAGDHSFHAVATDLLGFTATSAVVNATVYQRSSRWTAYNDHAPGAGTALFASTYDVFGNNAGFSGSLTNIVTGERLTPVLTFSRPATGVTAGGTMGTTQPGTPAAQIFNGYVDLLGSPNPGILLDAATGGAITNRFTSLQADLLYSFRGTAIRGEPTYTGRWTLCRLTGARAFLPAHTPGVLTSKEIPTLAPNEVVFNSGNNLAGDVVGWDNIWPGTNGDFAVECFHYTGALTNGATANDARAYAISAIRLEEIGPVPSVAITAPANNAVFTGPTNLAVSAAVGSPFAVTNVTFYSGGNLIGQDSSSPFSITWNYTNPPWTSHSLSAVVSDNAGGRSTSAVVNITVNEPPPNLADPTVLPGLVSPAPGARLTNLTQIIVRFSEPVSGVNASDLLVNGVAASGVTGSGSNYTFTIAQPAVGTAVVSWAESHGIVDQGYPVRAFDALAPGATWTYDVADGVPPGVIARAPASGSTLTNLTAVTVTFSEPVTGVQAHDFLVNGLPAYGVAGSGDTYTFSFGLPSYGTVNITWTNSHGITDLAGNPFLHTVASNRWNYTLRGQTITLIETNAVWHWRPGTNEASNPTNAWRLAGFDDSQWSQAPGPFYYDDQSPYFVGNTLLSNMRSNYSSVYFRIELVIPNIELVTNLTLHHAVDDGALVWLNGTQWLRYNVPSGEVPYNGLAPSSVGSTIADYTAVALPTPGALVQGTNIIAVHGLNNALATSSDLLMAFRVTAEYLDPAALAPRIGQIVPAAGEVFALTNITVVFTKPVTGVDAADLLLNGAPATGVTGSNETYTFAFAQPPYGYVNISWATNHGVLDINSVPFNARGLGAEWTYRLINSNAPVIAARVPARDDLVISLTNAAVTFSKAVTGVDAEDLLVNGAPAASVSGSGSNYVFSFPRPAYGTVAFTWAAAPAIVSTDNPADQFDPTDPDAAWSVTFVFQEPPVIAGITPLPGNLTNLTAIEVRFSETVTGVEAADLLLNGQPAAGLTINSSSNYLFTFPQPPVGALDITWAAGHGIADVGVPVLAFNGSGPGATWSYNVKDGVPPSITGHFPPQDAELSTWPQVEVTFSEAVNNVDAADLLINGLPATSLVVVGTNIFRFGISSPPYGPVQASWAAGNGITDVAGNPFDGATNGWSFVFINANTPMIIERIPAAGASTNVLTNILVRFNKAVTGVEARDLLVNGVAATNVVFENGAYIFALAQPAFGPVQVTWAVDHGIADAVLTAFVFEAFRPSASWSVDLYYQAPPVIATVVPGRGATVGLITQMSVTFSEAVAGVQAFDLLVNGSPATNVTGSGSNYVFYFPPPAIGTMTVSWVSNPGIMDLGVPQVAFDPAAPDASWTYNVAETTPPMVQSQFPVSGSVLSNLYQVQVVFSEPVNGVDAADLLVNGTPAYGVVGAGDTYAFSVNQPAYGTVNISWAASHGISDLAGNPFDGGGTGAAWSYVLQAPYAYLVVSNSTWRYFKGTSEASTPTTAWRQVGFNDSSWSTGPSWFYFGDSLTGTLVNDMAGGAYSSLYIRQRFVLDNPGFVSNLVLRAASDDGFVAWINGVEVARFNMGAVGSADPYNGFATATANEPQGNGPGYIAYPLSNPQPSTYLLAGTNVLTIHAFNQSASSSDFAINAELSCYLVGDPAAEPPRVLAFNPPSGELYVLSNLTVGFTKPVTNVDAGDLLINNVPATGLTGSNNLYTFHFAQPAYGVVSVTWATGHGITDLSVPAKVFDGTALSALTQYMFLNPNAPIIASRSPDGLATVANLTQVTVNFSKSVIGVNATDLLINGVSATNVSGSGLSYTFDFPPPNYGTVQFSWASGHGIQDLEGNVFDSSRPNASWQVPFADIIPPVVAAVLPAPDSIVTNLSQVTVRFSENVNGVNASDLLINGVAAQTMTGSGSNYVFNFPAVNAAVIRLTWSATHGIADRAAVPNAFNAGGPGAQWQYHSVDLEPPVVSHIYPTPGAEVTQLREVQITFSEPVQGVEGGWLLVNGLPANSVGGSGAGPYIFNFATPTTGAVQMAWAPGHTIRDLTVPPNVFTGQPWQYTYNPAADYAGKVVISEFMYHAPSHLAGDEWIEIRNLTDQPVNLTGWQFARGVSFTFPAMSLPAQGFLVIAADTNAFRALYPTVNNVIGNWQGQLSNNDEDIEIETVEGRRVDLVSYASQGDWAARRRGSVTYTGGFRGWEWYTPTDGLGNSLELINPNMPNDFGQNWRASTTSGGTPGALNTVASANVAPLILDVQHYPVIPTSTNSVRISARVLDEAINGLTVELYWRDSTSAAPGTFDSIAMNDSGINGDLLAGDGLYSATIPPYAHLSVIEFYVSAADASANTRTWPAPAIELDNSSLGQVANALYQVENGVVVYDQPSYRMIMTGAERQEMTDIWSYGNTVIDALMNTTFVVSDHAGVRVHYLCGVRNRGNSSRTAQPGNVHNYRVTIPNDNRFGGIKAFSLNCKYVHSQYLGNTMFRKGGLPTEDANLVRVYHNGVAQVPLIGSNVSGVPSGNSETFPYYVHLEELGGDWTDKHYPFNAGGNIYRCMRTANLTYLGTDWRSYTLAVNGGTGPQNYIKSSNKDLNDWSDLINLTYVISNTPDTNWNNAVSQVINVEQWMRYYAMMNLIGFGETSIGSDGDPDDFTIYRGPNDPRFVVFPHDHDTDFGEGDGSRQQPTISIWRAADDAGALAFNPKFLRRPGFVPMYYAALYEYATTVFATNEFNATVDQLIGPLGVPNAVTRLKSWGNRRVASVLSQINLNLTVTNLGGFTISNGWYVTASPAVTLQGLGNVIHTRQVRVRGVPAAWTAWNGQWSGSITLNPGFNRVTVDTLNSNGVVFASTNLSFFYDRGLMTDVAGAITADTIWLAANGPYNVTGNITVNSGVTLTIQAGTTLYLGSGVDLIVANGGRLLAEGSASAPIRFTRAPGASTTWGGLTVNGAVGSPQSRISHAHFEYNNDTAIDVNAGDVWLDHLSFGNTARQYLSLDGASFVVQNCTFPSATANFEATHGSAGIRSDGRGIFRRNFFGRVNGYNDALDFTGGNRPGPILQMYENVFMGSDDDLLDLDGTDAWIEGNIFLHTHRTNGAADSASAVSGGSDSTRTSEITVVGNLFFNVDQAANAKQGNYYTMLHNTIVKQNGVGSIDPETGVVILADDGTPQGLGMYLEGNIIYEAEQLTRNVTTAVVTYTNNLIYGLVGAPWAGLGGNNLTADPLFKRVPAIAETTNFTTWVQAQVLWDWFGLKAGSPAAGRGAGGRDWGAVEARGVTVAGEPEGATPESGATLRVGFNITGNGMAGGFPDGSGYSHYKWRLDGGEWSLEIPITTPITLSGLTAGPHYVEVVGRNDAGLWQDDSVLGEDARVSRTRTWVVDPDSSAVRINEVLASNQRAFSHYDTTPDALELFNPGNTPVNLSGMRLTDDPAVPDKFEFPSGASIGAGEYLVVLANDYDGTPGYHLEFTLRKEGMTLYLFDAVARGGVLLDSVAFGPQITDLSIGRLAGGEWGLARPTLGAPNVPQEVAAPTGVKINEWLTAGAVYYQTDFIELHNPLTVPVGLAGLYLTDNPEGWPNQHPLPPLSFIGARNYAVFYADGGDSGSLDSVGFRLSREHGIIGLMDAALKPVDVVFYDTLRPDYSMGRSPNGTANIMVFGEPTPGAGNPNLAGATNVVTTNIVLVDFTSTWWYNANNVDLGTGWRASDYNDAGWPQGPGMLGKSISGYPIPQGTTLPENAQPTVYFRTRFVATGDLTGFNLVLSHYIDDGAVFYLNGSEVNRYNITNTGGVPVSFTDRAVNVSGNAPLYGPVSLPLASLLPGTNVLAVEVHQSPSSTDMAMALNLTLTKSVTNVAGGVVVINEVFANGETFTNISGQASDWVELYNPGDLPVDLGGHGLTDTAGNPLRWTFPSGVILAGRSYLVVTCDPNWPASTNAVGALNTGFGLKANGGEVAIYDPAFTLMSRTAYGMQIPDYSVGRVADGNGQFVLTTPTPAAANAAVTLGDPLHLRLNEWMPNDKDGADDWFELFNPSALPVALGGLFVTDDLGNPLKSEIPALSFIGGRTNGYLKIIADNNMAAGANHARFKLDALRESLGLALANGVMIDQVSWNYAVSQPGVTEGRFPDGSSNVVFFPDTVSPGESNYRLLTNVVISEVLTHSDPPMEDAIELQNLTGQPVDISSWYLSDAKSQLAKYRIPANTVIPPYGFMVLYEYQFNTNAPDNPLAFSLSSAKGDEVYLSSADGGVLTGYRTSVDFGPALNGVSFGRYITSEGRQEFVAMSRRTLGVDEPENLTQFRGGLGATNAYPAVGMVGIRQVMYHPPDIGTNDNTRHEFIELYNRSALPVPLFDPMYPTNTWRLRGGVDFDFSTGLVLPGGGSVLVVSFDPVLDPALLDEFRLQYNVSTNIPVLGPYTGRLANNEESIELKQPDIPQPPVGENAGLVPYVLVERVHYRDTYPWPIEADGLGYSLQRVAPGLFGNDPVNWIAAPVTFLQTNEVILNTAPVLDAIPDQSVLQGALVVITNQATDAQQPVQSLTYELGAPIPSGAQIDPASGIFSWVATQVGTQTVTVIVRDNGSPSLSATQSFVVVVMPRQVGLAPSGNEFRITWSTVPGRSYKVQYKNDVNDANWTDLPGGTITATGGEASLSDAEFATRTRRFYRILLLP